MNKERIDAWTQEHDLLLAEVVLRNIREGGTQLQAFDEVGQKLNRTASACGFRWNGFVRKQYEMAIQLAKKQRKELKREISHLPKKQELVSSTEDHNVSYPSTNQVNSAEEVIDQEKEQLKAENEELRKQNEQMKEELGIAHEKLLMIKEDYEIIMTLMQRSKNYFK